MDMFNIAPIYSALVSRQRNTDAQRQVEWEAREADRLHRERARELKHKKIIDNDSWRRFPARLRIRKHLSETSTSSTDETDPPPRATAIRWADNE
ncbi:hypothetical protein FBU31_007289 [Coemansia sp. 'formosensis']|nr:hypothetical protein FBU31_007289 [Coemansia sp. 'formosensis']